MKLKWNRVAMNLRVPAVLVLLAVSIPPGTGAQTGQKGKRDVESNFDRIFGSIKPSGKNGYEELVTAGDALRQSWLFQALEETENGANAGKLSVKRAVLADPPVVEALDLLRRGLAKTVASPRMEPDDETTLPELAAFRQIARLLMVQIYVQLADGKVPAAIDTLRDGLRLGYVIQTDTLISGLVGIAVDAILIRSVAEHLDQLSSRDCDRLMALAREWLNAPDPAIAMLTAERDGATRILKKYRADPIKLLDMLVGQPDESDRGTYDELVQTIKTNPGSAGALVDQASAGVAAYYEGAIKNLRKPAWQREPAVFDSAGGPAAKMASMLLGADIAGRVADRYTREQAQIQLLAVHAAIRRYRWEYNRLPELLDAVKVGALAIDPFTGQPLTYVVKSPREYELFSAGPFDRGPDNRLTGGRTKLTLLPP